MYLVRIIGSVLFLIGLTIGIVGYLNQHGCLCLGGWEHFARDFYANLSTELVSIAFTVLIIDRAYQYHNLKSEKEDLKLQMGSEDGVFARDAVRRLRLRKWLMDGSLQGVDLSRADLHGKNVNLSKAKLVKVNLYKANLSGVNLYDSKLCKATLCEAILYGTILCKADLSGADLRGANLRGANLRNAIVTTEQLAQAESLEGAILPNGDVVQEQLRQQPGEVLRQAREQAGMSQAELAEAIGVSESTVRQWECRGVTPRSGNQEKIAEVLGVSPWQRGDDPEIPG